MTVTLVVLAIALTLALVEVVVSLSARHTDPLDPQSEVTWLVARLRHHPRALRFVRRRVDRSTASGLALTIVFAVVFLSALAVGSLFDMATHNSGFARFDQVVANWGSTNVTPGAVRVLKLVTALGATVTVIAVAALCGIVVSLRSRRPGPALFLAAVVLGQWALNNALKAAVGRERPDVGRFVHVSGSSFPSGHSTAAAATWAAVAFVLTVGRSRRVRAAAGGLTVLVAVAVAATRALLGAHWLTDVLAGLALGWGWFLLVAVVFGGRALRAGQPVERAAGRPVARRADAPLHARRRIAAGLVAALAAQVAVFSALGLLIVHLMDGHRLGRADESMNDWAVAHRTPGLDRVTSWLSNVGSTTVVIGIAVVAVVVLRLVSHRWRRPLVLAAGLVLEVVSFVIVANLVGRARPAVIRLDASPPTSSFPSGHTAASVALYVGVALLLTESVRRRGRRRLLVGLAGLVPLAVATARVYRGMHHVSDVVAGAVLGGLSLLAARRVVAIEPTAEVAPLEPADRTPTVLRSDPESAQAAAIAPAATASARS